MRNSSIHLAAALVLGAASLFAPVAASFAGEAADPAAATASQPPVKAGDLELTGIWSRAMLPGQPAGGGFVTITNSGSQDDRLLSVESPAAGRGEVHEMNVTDGVMKMRQLADGLVIPAGETVELKPGSYHLMFLDMKEPFKEGTMVPATLTFEKAGKVEVQLMVLPPNTGRMKMNQGDGKGMMHGEGHNMQQKKMMNK